VVGCHGGVDYRSSKGYVDMCTKDGLALMAVTASEARA
jgi:hypothetical protein